METGCCRHVIENLFATIKNWFTIFKVKRHHSVYLPIGAAKVQKYCRKFGAELQLDWQFIALVRTGLVVENGPP